MYAVIRAGGKQYRVAPGDVIKVEKLAPSDGNVEFNDILAVANDGKIGGPKGDTRVVGQVVEEGRDKKILVFHFKRKKQYKKLQGHRQPFTAVRITEITFDGSKFSAPALPDKKAKATPKASEGSAAPDEAVAPKKKATKKAAISGAAPGAGSKTAATRHAGGSKTTGSKSKGGAAPKPKKK